MTAVRMAHAQPMPGRLGNGEFHTRGYLVVLADDAGHRTVPIWLRGGPGRVARLDRNAFRLGGMPNSSSLPATFNLDGCLPISALWTTGQPLLIGTAAADRPA